MNKVYPSAAAALEGLLHDGMLIASAIDTLRRLDGHADTGRIAANFTFALSLDANYGVGIAKLRAAREAQLAARK